MYDSRPMTKEAEERVLDAVRAVAGLVESQNMHPTAAVVKVAMDRDLAADMVGLITSAFNVGRTTWQQEYGGPGVLDKQAEFPLAVIEDIREQLYPATPLTPAAEKSAAAVSSVYLRPPQVRPAAADMEKAAHYKLPESSLPERYTPGMDVQVRRAFAKAGVEKRSLEELRRRKTAARDALLGAMGAVRDYFKQAEYLRKPFAEVEYNANLLMGKAASHVLEFAYTEAKLREKRAAGPPSLLRQATPTAAPYNLIKHAIECGEQLLQADRSYRALEKTAALDVESITRPFAEAPSQIRSDSSFGSGAISSESTKRAGFFSTAMAAGLGASMKGGIEGIGKGREKDINRAETELTSPDHLQELREIEARTVLTDLMNNDEVISGYDPGEITQAYNEISQLSPRAATQPAVLRPLLRKHLTQGAMEPFEAQQVVDIEKGLANTGKPDPFIAPGPGKSDPAEIIGGNQILQ